MKTAKTIKNGMIIGIILFSSSFFLHAQDRTSPDGEAIIVITGSKFAETTDEASEKVEVVTAEEIRESGATNLSEALEQIPGISVGGRMSSSIMMQGFEGEYIRFLVDGVKLVGDIAGSLPTGQIPVSNIERIEIIRGSSSALYGSDAIGGVINIITKKEKPSEPELSANASFEISTNLRTFTTGALSYTTEGYSIGTTASLDHDNGKKKSYNRGRKEEEYYELPFSFLSSLGLKADFFNNQGKWGVFANYDQYISKYNSLSSAGIPSSESTYDNPRIYGGIRGEHEITERLSGSGFLSGNYFGLNLKSGSSTSEREYAGGEGEYRIEMTPCISHTLLAGTHVELETLKDEESFENEEWKKALHLSLFAQDDWNIGSRDLFLLTPGFRFDYTPPIGDEESGLSQFTPKLSLKADPTEDTTIRFSYGMGYKIPTLKQKYWFFHHTGSGSAVFNIYGNPDLKPEKSHGFNISLEQTFMERFSFSAAAYYNYIIDLIETPSNSDGSGGYVDTSYENIGKAVTYGGDTAIHYNHNDYSTSLSYAYTAAKSYENGEYTDLTGRVPHTVHLDSSYRFSKIALKVFGSTTWDAPMKLTSSGDVKSPDKLLLVLGAEKGIGEHFSIYIRGENLLNNYHFIKGEGSSYEGMNQEDYFGYYDGVIGMIGGRIEY